MIKPVQTQAAAYIARTKPEYRIASPDTYGKNVYLYPGNGSDRASYRFKVGPVATRYEKRYSADAGGDWFVIKSFKTKALAAKEAAAAEAKS